MRFWALAAQGPRMSMSGVRLLRCAVAMAFDEMDFHLVILTQYNNKNNIFGFLPRMKAKLNCRWARDMGSWWHVGSVGGTGVRCHCQVYRRHSKHVKTNKQKDINNPMWF
jgi:hypothetical protein